MSRDKMIPPGLADPGGTTPFKRFDNLLRRLLSVPKDEMDRRILNDERKGKPGGVLKQPKHT
jgi:hypothetical protein